MSGYYDRPSSDYFFFVQVLHLHSYLLVPKCKKESFIARRSAYSKIRCFRSCHMAIWTILNVSCIEFLVPVGQL